MNCPKCVGVLQKKIEHIDVDSCFSCEGIWFDAGELKEVIKSDSKDFKFIDAGREIYDGKEMAAIAKELDAKAGKCPKCADGTLLIAKKYDGKNKVKVDVCPKGHGVWLDGGEIQKLRDRGVVKLVEQVEVYMNCLRYLFSRDGFGDFMRQVKMSFRLKK